MVEQSGQAVAKIRFDGVGSGGDGPKYDGWSRMMDGQSGRAG